MGPHTHLFSTSNLLQNMDSHIQQAAHDILKVMGKRKELQVKKSDNPYIALMIYLSTPLHNGFSPSVLLMNRKLCTTLSILESQLQPLIPEYSVVSEKEAMRKANIKRNFDVRHRANTPDPLPVG